MKSIETRQEIEWFLELWNLLNVNPRMYRYWIKRRQISQSQRKLISAFYDFKHNKKEKGLDALKKIQCESSFLRGIQNYLIGLYYNQFCHYTYAIEALERSIKELSESKDDRFIFNPLILMVTVYANRRDEKNMQFYLEEAKKIKNLTEYGQAQLDYATLCLCTSQNDVKTAEILFKKLKERNDRIHQIFYPHNLVCIFMLYVAREDYKKCYQILDEYQKFDKAVTKVNYLYMKVLLDAITKDAPIYLYPKDFADFPEMFHQVEVIKALKLQEVQLAKKYWDLLQRHNPHLYKNNFEYKGGKCLFSIVLDKYRYQEEELITPFNIQGAKNNLEKLKKLVSQSQSAISHDELIRLIWDEEYSEANYLKLRKLCSDFSKKYPDTIKSKSGKIFILKKVA